MKFSVAYSFAPGIISQLAQYQEVDEIFGKLDRDFIGGGRSTYTLRLITKKHLIEAVQEAGKYGIAFNYLLNGAHLEGQEQTRKGQYQIRKMLDFLSHIGVSRLTVASPYLLRLIKKQYPQFQVRISAFAIIDSPLKAKQWEDMGADTLCISAIACNRDFSLLKAIRTAVQCDLQLIVNASCLLNCSHELTHMNMLTQSSRSNDPLKGLCLDYCFLNCSQKRLQDQINYIRSTWIRPEDLSYYENLGYHHFKILERSCPGELLLKRVHAYATRNFAGNLYELIAPVAQLSKKNKASLSQRLRMIYIMFRPLKVKISSLLKMKKYAETVMDHDFSAQDSPVYIDNQELEGFIKGIMKRQCRILDCEKCGYCQDWAVRTVTINETYRTQILKLAHELDEASVASTHWL